MTDSAHDARRYSFKLLGYKGRSKTELVERLKKKGFSEDVIRSTLKYLKDAGYIDDRSLAVSLKRQALENKLLGHAGARRLMLAKGISRELVEDVLEFDEEREFRNARKLASKKIRDKRTDLSPSGKRRLQNFLAYRGYSYGTISKVLKYHNINTDEED